MSLHRGGVAPSDNCTHPDACNFGEEGPCEFLSCVTFGCNVSVACNFDPEAQYNDGSCEYSTCTGCMNPAACDFNPDATLAGGCYDYASCAGCTSEDADNYTVCHPQQWVCIYNGCTVLGRNFDVTANSNDGSCDFASCGLFDQAAAATTVVQACWILRHPASNFDCEGNCLRIAAPSSWKVAQTHVRATLIPSPTQATKLRIQRAAAYPTAENYDQALTRRWKLRV